MKRRPFWAAVTATTGVSQRRRYTKPAKPVGNAKRPVAGAVHQG